MSETPCVLTSTSNCNEFLARCKEKNRDCIQCIAKILSFYNRMIDEAGQHELATTYGYYDSIIAGIIRDLDPVIAKDKEMGEHYDLFKANIDSEAARIKKAFVDAGIMFNRNVDTRVLNNVTNDNQSDLAAIYLPIMLLDYYWLTSNAMEKINQYRPINCTVPSKGTVDDLNTSMGEISRLLEYIFDKLVY